MARFRRRQPKEKPFRRGSTIEKPKRERRKKAVYTDKQGRRRPISQRKLLTPMDLIRGASGHLGQFGSNLAQGLQVTSKQVGPALRKSMASVRVQPGPISVQGPPAGPPVPSNMEPLPCPTCPTPGPSMSSREPMRPVPTGPGLGQIDKQILKERIIGTPQIVDKDDVISGRQEGELQRAVKDAMRHMPIGTDTSVEPIVTVVPRAQFHNQFGRTPAATTGRRNILVSDELWDLPPKERKAIVAHETLHALKHFNVYDQQVGPPPEWAEREADQLADTVEPEGSKAARRRYPTGPGGMIPGQAPQGGMMPGMMPGMGMPPMMGG